MQVLGNGQGREGGEEARLLWLLYSGIFLERGDVRGSLREQWSAELRGSNWGLMLLNIGGRGAGKQVAHRGPQNLCGCLSKVCGPGLGLYVQRVVL